MNTLRNLFVAACLPIIAGIITAYAMPPAGLWPCLFIGLSGLFWLWSRAQTYRRAFTAGLLFGLGYFVTGLWWIGNALLIEGNEFWWVWPISVIGLPTLLSLFTGFYLALARIFFKDTSFLSWVGFAAFLTLSEWVRGHIFTGFPWNLYGYGWSRVPEILQSASVVGAFGLTFFTVMVASAPIVFWQNENKKTKSILAASSLLLLTGSYYYGAHRLSQNETRYDEQTLVRIIQPNIAQSAKWDAGAIVPNFEEMLTQSAARVTQETQTLLIVWPETAIPPIVFESAFAQAQIAQTLKSLPANSYLLSGVLRRTEREGGTRLYYNSLVVLNENAETLAAYDKTHLVPFGEFIPFQQWIPITPVVSFNGFERGGGPVTLRAENAPSFSPLICYEIIFSGQVVDEKNRPDFLAAVTNDGWYGISAGPHQHFFQARMRAIEEGLPVIRSANTGVSGMIDPYGRVLQQSALMQKETLDALLPRRIETPPIYARSGNELWFLVLIGLAFGGGVIKKHQKNRP